MWTAMAKLTPASSRGDRRVARVLMTNPMCVECIMSQVGLDLDPVLGAIRALEADFRLIRTWGRCLSCLKRDRALLMVDVSSGSRKGSAVMYDGPERHDGHRCMKCKKPIGLALGECTLLRRGQPYHKACAPAVDPTT
jgi:hypothetical protein